MTRWFLVVLVLASCRPEILRAADPPLHERIDQLIEKQAAGKPFAESTDDAEFVRRIQLDLAGRIPTADETRTFLSNANPDKRQKHIDMLLAAESWPDRMADLFHVVLMERRGDDAAWHAWLRNSFAENKPWDQLVREILDPRAEDESARGAAFFMTKRLEKYGQNAIDFPGLVRDVGRLFLGQDLQCAECHDHLFINDYKQVDFKGLFAVYQNTFIRRDVKFPAIGEKAMTAKLEFVSVFDPTQKATGPRVPGGKEFELKIAEPPKVKPKTPPPRPEWSALELVAKEIAKPDNRQFARNAANRFWFAMLGRGIVHPLDLHHSENPAAHPELLDLLTDELIAHKLDLRFLIREITLTKAYQRSSRLPVDSAPPKPESFRVGIEKRISAEQLLNSVLTATSESERVRTKPETPEAEQKTPADESAEDVVDTSIPSLEELKKGFAAAFANGSREPEDEFSATVKGALFWRNGELVRRLLLRRESNLIDCLAAIDDSDALADELFLSVLSRMPADGERSAIGAFINSYGNDTDAGIGDAVWALLTSAEFYVNH